MSTEYTYSITTDFTNATQINLLQFKSEIHADVTIVVDCEYINRYEDEIKVNFPSALDGTQKSALDTLVSVYTYTAPAQPSITVSHQVVVSNDPINPGDYTSISDAFSAGEISVFIRNGTYVETSDIIIPNGGQINGELPGHTIIFMAGPYSIKIDGSGGVKETIGTISITNNTQIITGVGTTFTNLVIGNFILLGTNYYEIISIESDTQVTIKETYRGITIVGANYIAQPMYTGCVISNLIIVSNYSTGIYIRGARHGGMKAVAVTNCIKAIDIFDSSDLSIFQIVCTYSTDIGVSITNSYSISLHTVSVFNSLSNGFEIDSINVILESCSAENNNGIGINIKNNSEYVNLVNFISKSNNGIGINGEEYALYVNISNSDVSNNKVSGIYLLGHHNSISNNFVFKNKGNAITSGLESNIIGNSIIDNIGDGIKIPVGSNECIVTCNNLEDNTGIGINMLSNRSSVSDNIIQGSGGDGIYLNDIKCRVSGNIVRNNTGKGIHIDSGGGRAVISGNIVETSTGNGLEIISGATNCIVTSNNLEDNTGTNYVDGGTGTVFANNITT